MNISVVIPTFNRYEKLKSAVTSVVAQHYLADEIIVIDDGSTDNTRNIQDDFPQIKYLFQKNSGVSSARNLGIKTATSEWIAFLDSDDEWHREKLQNQVEFHKQNPEILMSYTDEHWIRDGLCVNLPKKFSKYGGDIFTQCLAHCIIAPSATMIHKNLLDRVGFFDESLEVCEDYDLWLRVALEHKIGLIDKKLITKYGGAEDQLSMKYWGMDRFRVLALEKLVDKAGDKKELIIQTLLKKYRVLLKGAIKYDRISDIKKYDKRVDFLEDIVCQK